MRQGDGHKVVVFPQAQNRVLNGEGTKARHIEGLADKAKVYISALQIPEHRVGAAFTHLEVYIRIFAAEARYDLRKQTFVDRADGPDPDHGLFVLRGDLNIVGRLLQKGEDGLRPLPQQASFRRDFQMALIADKERGTQLLLQGF